MTLSLAGKTRRRQGLLVLLGTLAVAGTMLAGGLLRAGSATADETEVLRPGAHGAPLAWTRSNSGSNYLQHINWINADGCNSNDTRYLKSSTAGEVADFKVVITSAIPNGQAIRSASIYVCYRASSADTVGGTFQTYYMTDGSTTYSENIIASSRSMTHEIISVDGPDVVKLSGTTLHVGIRKTGDGAPGSNEVRVYSIGVKIIYGDSAPEPVATDTAVTCTPGTIAEGGSTTCEATVSGAPDVPAGTVTFTTDAGGTFPGGSTCALSGGTCSVTYTTSSTAGIPHTITAAYQPTSNHSVSQGTAGVTVLPADTDGDGVPDASDACPGTPAGTNVDAGGCPFRTLRIIKVVEQVGAGVPPPATFSGTISPHSQSPWQVSGGGASDIDGVAGYASQSVVEEAPPDNWAFEGYSVNQGLLSTCAGASFSGARADGATVPASDAGYTGDYTVCILNRYTPPVGSIAINKVVLPVGARDTASFAFDYGQLAGGTSPMGHGDTSTFADVQPGQYTIRETGVPSNWSVEVACESNAVAGGWGGPGASITLGLQAFEDIECTFTNTQVSRTIRIIKVTESAGGAPVPPTTTFRGTITNAGDGTWTIDTATDLLLDFTVEPFLDHAIAEDTGQLGPGWEFDGFRLAPGTHDDCSGDAFAGAWNKKLSASVPDDGADYTVCVRNRYTPPRIMVAKVVSGALANPADTFEISVQQTDGAFVRKFEIAASGAPVAFDVPAGTYTVTEASPANIGAGYLPAGYSQGTLDAEGAVACDTPSETLPARTLAGGDIYVVCVHNVAATLPTMVKDAAGFRDGIATWRIAIDNTGDGAIARAVKVTDAGATLIPTEGCGQAGSVITCQVPPDSEMAFDVTVEVQGTTCAERTLANEASGTVITAAGDISIGAAGPAEVSVPGNPDICDLPLLSKKPIGHINGAARWTITIDNRVADAGPRTIVIDDEDTTLVSAPASCGGAQPDDTVAGIECQVAAGGVVTLVVEREEPPACDPRETVNTAEAFVRLSGGTTTPVQNSPTMPTTIIVPGDDVLCEARITVRKMFDSDEDGQVGLPPHTLVDGWSISVACDGETIPGSPGVTGADGTGTVSFTVPAPAGGKTCVVSEATVPLTRVVGHAVDGGALAPGGSATVTLAGRDDVSVTFLNHPVDLGPPAPTNAVDAVVPDSASAAPSPTPPKPGQGPETPEPLPTPAGASPGDVTPDPAPDLTSVPTAAATEPARPAVATPAAPNTGSGRADGAAGRPAPLLLTLLGLVALSTAGALLAASRTR